MIIYNAHTHIFNLECIPNKFIRFGFMRVMAKNRFSLFFVRGLDKIFTSETDFLSKQSAFLRYNTEDWQESIFIKLKSIYPEGTKFVVLTVDMDFMDAGVAERDFVAQVAEVVNLKRIYANSMLPFLCVDPRRGDANDNLNFVKKYIEHHGFVGIKMYPPLGFFPFDERLKKVYAYAQQNNIPVLSHCSRNGGIYYKGDIQPEWLNPRPGLSFKKEKMKKFRNNFMDPKNYYHVMDEFPDLKICLAHYGGDEEVLSDKNDSWTNEIKRLMIKYPNFYTDISYTLYSEKAYPIMDKDIKNNAYGNRILFGTDFYMTEREKKEKELKDGFRYFIGEESFEKIAYRNPKNFLSSSFANFNA